MKPGIFQTVKLLWIIVIAADCGVCRGLRSTAEGFSRWARGFRFRWRLATETRVCWGCGSEFCRNRKGSLAHYPGFDLCPECAENDETRRAFVALPARRAP